MTEPEPDTKEAWPVPKPANNDAGHLPSEDLTGPDTPFEAEADNDE